MELLSLEFLNGCCLILEGFNCGKASVPKTGEGAKEFIAFLQLNKIPGIGAVTINKLIKVAEENGYL